jgi:hypothetical protein
MSPAWSSLSGPRRALFLLSVALGAQSWIACGSADSGATSERVEEAEGYDAGRPSPRDAGRAAGKDAGRDAGKEARVVIEAVPTDPEGDPDMCAGITASAPPLRGKVDIIWLIDNSPSMFDKVLRVAANMTSFFESVQSAGADTRVITITLADPAGGTPLAMDAETYRYVPGNVWSGLVYSTAITSFEQYRDFVRPDAATHIVIVSDDNDIVSAGDFQQQMEGLLGHAFTLHAIVADAPLCGAAVGDNYLAAADATMGTKMSICTEDWTQVFGDLTTAVIEAVPLPCSYDLESAASADSNYDAEKVQVAYTPAETQDRQELPKSSSDAQCGDKLGWYYDKELDPKLITLCPAACELVKQGGSMNIAFGCKPTIFL